MKNVMTREKQTQGRKKLHAYIERLSRNEPLCRDLERIYGNQEVSPGQRYKAMSKEEREKEDSFEQEFYSIAKEYNRLKRRCRKLLRTTGIQMRLEIAEKYGLDCALMSATNALRRGKKIDFENYADFTDLDICRATNIFGELFSSTTDGDDLFPLLFYKQCELAAYPCAILVHARASKRDVLDYVAKRWARIEGCLVRADISMLKIKPYKYGLQIRDIIWQYRGLTSSEIKNILDKKVHGHGLSYNEINKIRLAEKELRDEDI